MEKILWENVTAGPPVHIAMTLIDHKYSRTLHTHDFAEFFIVESGSGQHLLTDGELPLLAGDLVFIAPQHFHSLRGEQLQIVNIAFPARLLTECMHLSPALAACYGGDQPHVMQSTRLQRERLHYWVQQLGPAQANELGVQVMLLDLMRNADVEEEAAQGPFWLQEALIELAEPPLLSEGMSALVRLSGRSREYIWRTCKQYHQRSPQELIMQLRMNYAERRLRLSDDPILHICYDCGLSNISYFYRMFQKSYALTPKRYRQQHHQAIT